MKNMNINRINGGDFLKKIKILLIFIMVLSSLFMVMPIAYGEGIAIPILMYHNITGLDDEGDGLNISQKRFEEQIRYLKYHGYNTIDFEEMNSYFKGEIELPANPVIITFDDGYESNYQYGYPILKKYSYKATVFMITDYIDKEGYMSGDTLKKIQSDGIFDVESHSVSHDYNLSKLTHDEMVQEVKNSKQRLEELLEKPVNIFCYPYGRNSDKLRQVLKDEGYIIGVTTQYGVVSKDSDFLRLKRIRVFGNESGDNLIKRIERNTKNFTAPVFKDVDINSPELLELINALEKEFVQVEEENGLDIFIAGSYYTEDKSAPKDVFALDIDNDSLERITYFNDIDNYRLNVEKIYSSPDKKKLLVQVRALKDNTLSIKLIDIINTQVNTVIEIAASESVNNICWMSNEKFALQISDTEKEKILIYDTSIRILLEKVL